MEPIYVVGHRNPDTDSIVSAMAYAALRAAMGDRRYVAARLGQLSDETKRVLDRFGFEPPLFLRDVRTQVGDLDFDVPPILHEAVTVSRAWAALTEERGSSALPLADDAGRLRGVLTAGDVAVYSMSAIEDPVLRDVPLFNILSVLEGQVIAGASAELSAVSGEVVLALPRRTERPPFRSRDTVLICGDQPELLRAAADFGVRFAVLCQAELPGELRKDAGGMCVISTPCDGYRAARRVFQAIPASRVAKKEDLRYFRLSDYLDDVREEVSRSRFRSYPILDADGKVAGTLSRYHLLQPRRKQVVLVDHNETAQSVPGLEQAEILEIVDHHRLADIQTRSPIRFRNEPVGSTATIVAEMYQEKGLMPSPRLSGLMAAAILSDTVMFKSPTATPRDRLMAQRLARVAGISAEDLGRTVFSEGPSEHRSAEELFFADYKEFRIAGHSFAISQITSTDSGRYLARKAEFLALMERTRDEHGYSMLLLVLTDVLLEGSRVLCVGDEDRFEQAFHAELREHEVFLPGVMSRKKQVVPTLTALWG